MCDLTTNPSQFHPSVGSWERSSLLWPLSPSKLSLPPGLPEPLSLSLLEAGPQPSAGAHRTMHPTWTESSFGSIISWVTSGRSQASLSLRVLVCQVRAVALSGLGGSWGSGFWAWTLSVPSPALSSHDSPKARQEVDHHGRPQVAPTSCAS